MRSGKITLLVSFGLLLAAASAIVLAAKPAPPPPPGPPPIVFDLVLLPGVSGHQIMDVNEAGDITLYPDMVYIAATSELLQGNQLLVDPTWSINRTFAINDVGDIACHATYIGEATPELTPFDSHYIGLLDVVDGSFTPLFQGWETGPWIGGVNDAGQVCGYNPPAPSSAFIMTPGDAGPQLLFPEEEGIIDSQAYAINNFGQVVGRRDAKGFRYTPGEGTLMVGKIVADSRVRDLNRAMSINDSGEFAGYAMGKASVKGFGYDGWKAYRYTDGVGMTALSSTDSTAQSINAAGDVVWHYYWSSPSESLVNLRAENVNVSLRATGVVQGAAADLTRWRNESHQMACINADRTIYGEFSNDRQVFVLTPRP
jgi:hypothetical protein